MFLYTDLKSAKVTLVISYCFCALLLALMIFAKPILSWFYGTNGARAMTIIMTAFYICCPAAWVALGGIIRLMKNIIKKEIFCEKNVFLLRLLSWCCAFVCVICLGFGIQYFPLLIFSAGAGFMMLILRVLKSVMAKATEIRKENELTI